MRITLPHSAGFPLPEWLIEGVCKKPLKLSSSVKQQKINKNTTVLVCCTFVRNTKTNQGYIFKPAKKSLGDESLLFFFHWIIASANTMAPVVRTEFNMQHSSNAFHHPWSFQCSLIQPLLKITVTMPSIFAGLLDKHVRKI